MELKNSSIILTLPDDLEWIDKYIWTTTKENINTALNGALVIQTAQQTVGRPITLQGGADYAWLSRDDIEKLQQLADAGENMTLTFKDNTTYSVRFRYSQGAFEANPIAPNWDKFGDITIRLMEV
jgi:hypothetical protein